MTESSALTFDFRGYVENTTKFEYIRDDRDVTVLNGARVRWNIDGRSGEYFDFGIGVVGQIYSGATGVSLVRYLPQRERAQLVPGDPANGIPGAEERFFYRFENNNYIQEAFATLYKSNIRLRVGRHKFYSGTGYAYNPIDLFNPPQPLDPSYEVDGIDAMMLTVDLPRQIELEGLVRLSDRLARADYQGRLKSSIHGWDFALQYTHFVKDRIDWEAINSEDADQVPAGGLDPSVFTHRFRWQLVGGEFAGELLDIGIYGEGGYVFVERITDVGTLTQAAKDHERFLLGLDHTFESQWYVMAEYLVLGQGRTDRSQITLNDRMAMYAGEVLAIDRNTIFTGVSYPITDLAEISLYGIIGVDDPSGLLNPWLEYSVYPGVKLSATAFFPIGDEEGQNGRGGPGGFARLKFNF